MLVLLRILIEYEVIPTDYHFVRLRKSHLVNMGHVIRFDREGKSYIAQYFEKRLP